MTRQTLLLFAFACLTAASHASTSTEETTRVASVDAAQLQDIGPRANHRAQAGTPALPGVAANAAHEKSQMPAGALMFAGLFLSVAWLFSKRGAPSTGPRASGANIPFPRPAKVEARQHPAATQGPAPVAHDHDRRRSTDRRA